MLYNAGGMTTIPKQMMMKMVKDKIEEIGVEVYDPSSQPFNDKKSVGGNDIARKIVAKDTEAIYNSDIYLINTQEDNLGTCIEAGVIKGYTDHATVIYQLVEECAGKMSSETILELIMETCEHQITKEYVPYHTDIRIHDEPETGFRRSVGFHQFLRGVNLTLGGYHIDNAGDNDENVFDGFFSLNDALGYVENVHQQGYPNQDKESPIYVSVHDNGSIETIVKELT